MGKLANSYKEAFDKMQGITFFQEPDFAKSNYWLNVLLLNQEYAYFRDQLLELTHREGILTRPAWELMPQLTMYKDCPKMDLGIAGNICRLLINLPSGVVVPKFFGGEYEKLWRGISFLVL